MHARPWMHTLLYWTDTECSKTIKRSNKILNVTRIKLYPWSAALLGSIATSIESSLGQSHVHCFLGLLVDILDLLVQLINFVLLLASFEIRNLGFQLRHLLLILPVKQTRDAKSVRKGSKTEIMQAWSTTPTTLGAFARTPCRKRIDDTRLTYMHRTTSSLSPARLRCPAMIAIRFSVKK